MMQEPSELQSNDDFEQTDVEQDTNAELDTNQALESDPASDPQHEQNGDDVDNSGVNQEAINAAISKQHAKYREEQRKRQAAEKRLQELEQQGATVNDPEPSIPEVDMYASDAAEQLKRRDEALRNHTTWGYRQQQRQQEQQAYQQQQYSEQQQSAAQQAEKFFDQAKQLKVNQTELNQAISTVGQYQLGHEVANYLMGDDRGVQMTQALAKQPALLADLSTMNPTQAILHIERNIRPKLQAQPRVSGASSPPKRVAGRASNAKDSYPLTGGKVSVE